MSEYIYSLEFDDNYKLEDPINKIVYEIANFIKNEHNFDKAFETIKINSLSFEDVISRSVRFDKDDVTTLADLLIAKM